MFDRYLRNLQEIPVTMGLFFIHILLYGLLWNADPSFSAWVYVPGGGDVLERFGAQTAPLVWGGEYYRLISCAFLHGSLLHLFMNNMALYVLGRLLERLYGSFAFAVLYLLSLVAGSLVSLVWTTPIALSVGASGAIMGLAGALTMFLLLDRNGRFLITTSFGKFFFLVLIAFNLLLGEWFEAINGEAHLGGFLAGCAFGVFFWSRIPGVVFPRWLGSVVLGLCVFSIVGIGYRGLFPEGTKAWHFSKGIEAFRAGQEKASEQHLARSVALGSKRAAPYLGELYVQTKQWKKAKQLYQGLAEKGSKQWNVWLQWLTTLGELDETKEAERVFQRVQKRFAKEFELDGFRALFYSSVRREREAILLYQRLLEEEPYHANYNNNLAWILVTAHQKKYRNPVLAKKHAEISVKRSGYQVAAYLDTLAAAHGALGQPTQAVALLRKALRAPDADTQKLHLLRQLRKFEAQVKAQKATTQPTSRPASTQPISRMVAPF